MLDTDTIEKWRRLAKSTRVREMDRFGVAPGVVRVVAVMPEEGAKVGPPEGVEGWWAEAVPTLVSEVERLRAALSTEEAEVRRLAERGMARQKEHDETRAKFAAAEVDRRALLLRFEEAAGLAATLSRVLGEQTRVSDLRALPGLCRKPATDEEGRSGPCGRPEGHGGACDPML
jgi:hypothetical protein